MPKTATKLDATASTFCDDYKKLREEIAKVIVGHEEIVEGVLICLFAGGHALLEGVPGLGKTLLIRTLSDALHLQFSRIQFTPDLMPADIFGFAKAWYYHPPHGRIPITGVDSDLNRDHRAK